MQKVGQSVSNLRAGMSHLAVITDKNWSLKHKFYNLKDTIPIWQMYISIFYAKLKQTAVLICPEILWINVFLYWKYFINAVQKFFGKNNVGFFF